MLDMAFYMCYSTYRKSSLCWTNIPQGVYFLVKAVYLSVLPALIFLSDRFRIRLNCEEMIINC